LGDELVTSITLSKVCEGNGYSLPSLQGAALNLAAEAQAGELKESDAFKQLVEGAGIEVRSIYGRPFIMRNYHPKFVVLGNHMPRFKSGTDAELRRSRFIDFAKKAKIVDPTLQPRIASERDGIFSQVMVPRLQQLLRKLEMPMGDPKSIKLRDRFAVENDSLQAFADECCNLGANRHETKDRLHAAFEHFSERNDVAAGLRERTVFFRKLRERFPNLEGYRPRVDLSGQGGTPSRGNRNEERQRENELRGIELKEGVNCSPIINLKQWHDEER
jgi:putative DNA primase/helicase